MSLRNLSPVLWIAFFLCVLEVGLEVRAARRGWGTLLFGAENAGEGQQASGEFGPTDAFPFRSRIVAAERARDSARLWIASSSYAEDKRIPATQIFPNRLEQLLRDGGCAVQVLNASRNGYTTASNLSVLRESGAQWQPDVCVLYQMTNDVDWITNTLLTPGADPEANIGPDSASASKARDIGWIEEVSEETTIFSVLKSNLTSRLSAGRILVDELPPRAQQAFEAYVHAFIDESLKLGARPVLCTFATRHTRLTEDQVPESVALALRRVNLYLSMRGWIDSVQTFNDVVCRVAAERDVTLIDVASAIADKHKHFRDFSHFQETGHAIVAQTMYAVLSELPRLQREGAGD
ncbi:MAG: hypothetical protein ACI841_004791 [Planctomycetota bacterium]|jgi:hypothetical protein